MDITFLTEEEIFGSRKLEIFDKIGTIAAITDFSILLGGDTATEDYYFTDGKNYVGAY